MDIDVFSDSTVEWVKILVNDVIKDTLTSPPYSTTMYLDDGLYTLKFRSRNAAGQEGESGEVHIGVNMPWEEATPTPSPIPSPTPTP
jgi:hypothetical protein